MSCCFEDLFDNELVEKGTKCKWKCLKTNCHKNSTTKDDLHSHCKRCQKDFYLKNFDILIQK